MARFKSPLTPLLCAVWKGKFTMNGEHRLRIFISYTAKGKAVWEPLVELIKKLYQCEIIWGQDEVVKYQDPGSMMEDMVKKGDIALFLLTNDSAGVCQEMKLWYEHNSNKFINALLLKDPSVPYETVKERTGFSPTYKDLSSDNPWGYIHLVFPALEEFIKKGLVTANIPAWEREYNAILREYSWRVKSGAVPLNRIKKSFRGISGKSKYGNPEKWSFRINWHANLPDLDSYSKNINCLDLLKALLQTDATREEYEFIFGAIDRVVESSVEPPRKLSGNILFSGCSITTLKESQLLLGDFPFEKDTGVTRRRAKHAEQVPEKPEALLLPRNLLTYKDNYDRFVASQLLILNAVSKICKYVVCSTVEVTVSHSFLLSTEDGSDDSGVLAMSCTATRTNKESLAAISEVPVVIEENGNVVWFGQFYKKPSSEYMPHWLYHNRNRTSRVRKNLILHFHPIELVDAYRKAADDYRKVHRGEGIHMVSEEFINAITLIFRGSNVDFHVYEDYGRYSSRDAEFGTFMQENIGDDDGTYSVIWKPNHGLWVFLDDRNCSDSTLVDTLLALDTISRRAADYTSKLSI